MGNLSTPKTVQKLPKALHAKAKAEADYRFYALYDKISRDDILAHAYAQCRSNKGAPGVDGQDFIETYGRASSKCGHVRDAPKAEIASKHERFCKGLRSLRATATDRLTDLRGPAVQRSCASARRVARKIRFVEADQRDLPCPVPSAKIFRFFRNANQSMWFAIPSRKRGVGHRHERWGGLRWTRQRPRAGVIEGRVLIDP